MLRARANCRYERDDADDLEVKKTCRLAHRCASPYWKTPERDANRPGDAPALCRSWLGRSVGKEASERLGAGRAVARAVCQGAPQGQLRTQTQFGAGGIRAERIGSPRWTAPMGHTHANTLRDHPRKCCVRRLSNALASAHKRLVRLQAPNLTRPPAFAPVGDAAQPPATDWHGRSAVVFSHRRRGSPRWCNHMAPMPCFARGLSRRRDPLPNDILPCGPCTIEPANSLEL